MPRLSHFYATGVAVAVGTDSLASVPTLNLWDELHEMRRLAPDVTAAALLHSATWQGAQALGDQKFGKPQFNKGEDESPTGTESENKYEKALRDAGLLSGPSPDGYYKEWLENAERQGVPPDVIVDIARVDPEEVADAYPDTPILGFTKHADDTVVHVCAA